jgi:hypothetical protein
LSGPRQASGEHRALARLAGHGHVAAHHARELAWNRKAEPRPAITTRSQGIRLGEFLEQLRLLFGSEADAGIRDRKLDPVAADVLPSCTVKTPPKQEKGGVSGAIGGASEGSA